MVQGITTNTIKDPTNLPQWEDRFKAVMGHLGHIGNAFEAMMYIIYTVFPTVENFNSWRMENQATAMEAVSKALQYLNDIKAIFNECQNPDQWKKDLKTHKIGCSNQLVADISKLLKLVQNNPALKGIAGSIITQLKVITHASSNPSMWVKINNQWELSKNDITWWDGTKEVKGTPSSYIEWMWSREWQGKSPVGQTLYQTSYCKNSEGQWVIQIVVNDSIVKQMSVKDFLAMVQKNVEAGKPVYPEEGTQNPIFLPNGTVKYWLDGWHTVTKSQYIQEIDSQVAGAILGGKPVGITIQQVVPENELPDDGSDPKYTTGPTTEAFAAISTMFNSQSSEQQSKFKYLQSNMEQYLGIENSTMTQVIKAEENITGFTKQQSN